jgi:lycopene cyclase domain-containing protein
VPVYPAASLAAAAAVIVLELAVLRTGIFRKPAYWVAMLVSYTFMVPVDGWLTKLSAPIVLYHDGDTSGLRPVWDILAEEFLYAFALLTLVIALWDWAGRWDGDPPPAPGPRS